MRKKEMKAVRPHPGIPSDIKCDPPLQRSDVAPI